MLLLLRRIVDVIVVDWVVGRVEGVDEIRSVVDQF